MKRLIAILLTLSLVAGCGVCLADGPVRILASFYPMHILALNVLDGVAGVTLDCLTAPETGCLHDYQLLVSDMMKLSQADALIVCGAGMESYLDDVVAQFPDLVLVDCSQGIDLLPAEEGHYHHEEDGDEEEYNAHTWLDPQNAILIVHTISDAALKLVPDQADVIRANEAAYVARLEALDETLKALLAPVAGRKIVTFHEAFPYFARAYGLDVAAVISEDHEESLSPAQLAAVIDAVRAAGTPPLFTEPQYSAVAAYAVAAETGAGIYSLDPLASGEIDPLAYENGMLANAEALLVAFGLK